MLFRSFDCTFIQLDGVFEALGDVVFRVARRGAGRCWWDLAWEDSIRVQRQCNSRSFGLQQVDFVFKIRSTKNNYKKQAIQEKKEKKTKDHCTTKIRTYLHLREARERFSMDDFTISIRLHKAAFCCSLVCSSSLLISTSLSSGSRFKKNMKKED